MNKLLGFLAVSLLASASTAVAAERTLWLGRDLTNDRITWTCTNTFGDSWTLERATEKLGNLKAVNSTGDFIELVSKSNKDIRFRLYKNKLSMNEPGSRVLWTSLAKGKWYE